MDGRSFDAIAQALAGSDRRRVLRLLAGALLGGVLALPGLAAAAAACRHNRDCPGRQVCRNRTCVRTCGDSYTCGSGGGGCPVGCFCAKAPGGEGLCAQAGGPACATLAACDSHGDCPRGEVCGTGCCTPEFVCLPKCR